MTETQPVKTTSGGGFTFEDRFGAYLAASMLSHQPVLGWWLGPPIRVDFQVGARGWRLDDVLVTFASSTGSVRCAFSVKSFPYIGATVPADLADRCWAEIAGRSGSGFVSNIDLLGVATAPLPISVFNDLQELIRLSSHQDPDSLAANIETQGYVSAARVKLWNGFKLPSTADALNPGASSSPGRLLSRLRVLEVDFENTPSQSMGIALKWSAESLVEPARVVDLWDALVVMVADCRTAGGYLDRGKLLSNLSSRFEFRTDKDRRGKKLDTLLRKSNGRLIERWMAAGVSDEQATELALDSSVGRPKFDIPHVGLVAIVSDFGAGKSVILERQHQADIDLFRDIQGSGLPVFIAARNITTDLESEIQSKCSDLGRYDEEGLSVVVDGLDEMGFARANTTLNEARALVRSLPNCRIVVTARPGLAFRPEETRLVDPLSNSEIEELSFRLTGHQFALTSMPSPVKDAIRWPLFTIIALNRIRRAADVPNSRALFIDAMVMDALGSDRILVMHQSRILAQVAKISLMGSGYFTAADIGGPAAVAQVLETRLVVERGGVLSFALPIIEQYFGAHALIEGDIPVSTVVATLGSFEPWRYPFTVAIGLADWSRSSELLTALGELAPGAACWVIDQAVSKNVRHTPAGQVGLPDSLECAIRLKKALDSWLG